MRTCSDAQLAQSFERGARDLKNGMRAAVCLLDLELARMPEDALRLFRENYQLGATYPVAAYNAGSVQSGKLYEELPPDALADASRSLDLPLKAFQYRKAVAHRKKKARASVVIVNNETRYYLVKMFATWGIVDDWMASTDVSAMKPSSVGDSSDVDGAQDQP